MSPPPGGSIVSPGPPPPFVIGWEEWLALPGLGLAAIKAKIDTGAKTSALHAFLIEPFTDQGRDFVRFGVHPIPGRDAIEIYCTSQLIGQREVTSSNGDKENRYVISTPVQMAGRTWEIEITLTNREGMAYRMLLGRQAIRDGTLVDPIGSFLQPRLSHRLYGIKAASKRLHRLAAGDHDAGTNPSADTATASPAGKSRLRIAIVTRQPTSASNRRLIDAASRRGHTMVVVDLATVTLALGSIPPLTSTTAEQSGQRPASSLQFEGQTLDGFDVAISRFLGGNGAFGTAVIRALEATGCQGLNASESLDQLRNALALAQALDRVGARQVTAVLTDTNWTEQLKAAAKATPELSVLTVGGRAIAGIAMHDGATTDAAGAGAAADFAQAERIASTLGLGLAAIDFGSDDDGRFVIRVTGSPRIGLFERVTGARVAEAILDEIEARAGRDTAPPDDG
jgi:ribosomal protein S6--L-glutamate ligase